MITGFGSVKKETQDLGKNGFFLKLKVEMLGHGGPIPKLVIIKRVQKISRNY